jgi:hypothetical protein
MEVTSDPGNVDMTDGGYKFKKDNEPGRKKCDTCGGTGWYGDNGPGIRGNREYQPCDVCKPEMERVSEKKGSE